MGSSTSSSQGKFIVAKCRDKVVEPPNTFLSITFDPKPFAEGSFRHAFKGTICLSSTNDKDSDVGCFRGLKARVGWTKNTQGTISCVVKKFKESHAMITDCWNKDVHLLLKAQELAHQFNTQFDGRLDYTIMFADPLIAEVTKVGFCSESVSATGGLGGAVVGAAVGAGARAVVIQTVASGCVALSGVGGLVIGGALFGLSLAAGMQESSVKGMERVCVEPFLTGCYQKLNSNTGWVRSSDQSATAQAFSHWTWCETGGDVLLCDLQGTYSPTTKNWLLTDPSAHSNDTGKFGKTDGGPRGADKFFAHHVCSDLCKHLPRKAPEPGPPLSIIPRERTSFSWEFVTAELAPAVCASSEIHDQSGKTCYAHASATILRAAEGRVVGRKVQSHGSLVQKIVNIFGTDGGHVERVLEKECPPRRLRFKSICCNAAVATLRLGRPVLLCFYLSVRQWGQFRTFFSEKPSGIMTAKVLTEDGLAKSGHAVVIVGQEHGVWEIKNSWGANFADKGRFKIKWDAFPANCTKLFDVFWVESDLTAAEKRAYAQ